MEMSDNVSKFYEGIVSDTISSCQEIFLDEGIDEGVLHELEHLWKGKLKPNGRGEKKSNEEPQVATPIGRRCSDDQESVVKFIGVQPSSAAASNMPPFMSTSSMTPTTMSSTTMPGVTNQNVNSSTSQIFVNNQRQVQARNVFPPAAPHQQARPYPNMYALQRGVVYNPFRMVPIQITLSNGEAIFVQVPHMLLLRQRIQYLLSPLISQATIGLNPMQASQVIQQHINNYVQAHTQNAAALASAAAAAAAAAAATSSSQPRPPNLTVFRQLDGQDDSRKRKKAQGSESSDEDNSKGSNEIDSEDSDDSVESQNEETKSQCEGDDNVSLNSDDDITDTETDYFQTDNLIVCQYFKISRIRNVWRLILKDGIANLNGKDFVFERMIGEASW